MNNVNKGKKLPAEILSEAEVFSLLGQCSNRFPTGIRNQAIIVMGWKVGLRVSEVLNLKIKDVDLEKGIIRVLHGKGDKARTVGIDPTTCAVVARWMETRKQFKIKRNDPLFCTISKNNLGHQVSPDYIRQLLPRLAKKAGLERRVHFHMLRHSFACQKIEEGTQINKLQKQLGHKHLNTTANYIDHLSPQEIIDDNRNRPEWGGNLYGKLLK